MLYAPGVADRHGPPRLLGAGLAAILSEMIAAKYSHTGAPLKDRADERIHSN